MIRYNGMWQLMFQMEGSVVPFAAMVGVPCAIASATLKYLEVNEVWWFGDFLEKYQIKGTAYGAFSSLLGFLVVFRTSQAYSRYWSGGGLMQQMCGSWFDAASSIVAFCKMSKAEPDVIERFQHLLLRLFSILTALAMTELQGTDESNIEAMYNRLDKLEIIDGQSLHKETCRALRESENKIELVFQWIQSVMVSGIDEGILNIPPPVLARAFNELADGMVMFHDCMKICILPFPFPYSQTTLILLVCHLIITPVMVCTWTANVFLSALFSFLVVFIFWGLYAIATELENPFGDDPNDLDAVEVQHGMNEKLLMLFLSEGSKLTPSLVADVSNAEFEAKAMARRMSLREVWGDHVPESAQTGTRASRRSYLGVKESPDDDLEQELLSSPAATSPPPELEHGC
mmetsp:Transcript_36054/g.100022  ORF Transcript_36054/g.100022 Transcript_36054/m.100022 type:complete len:402 (-) Transcript_36054:42-1247(-)